VQRVDGTYGRVACGLDMSPELDSSYSPNLYTGSQFQDNPFATLQQNYGKLEVLFDATAYLMWRPNTASGCSAGAACNITVPLATLSWTWTGDAINTLKTTQNGTTWMLTGCQSCSNNAAQPSNFAMAISNRSAPVYDSGR